jgi:diguanylate cyclase (GGDEF)-like protein/hemerythrin-like metal-binding protein/PAS domain S-box-containing protein
MFEIFPWNPHLETGIELIDEQHRVLVNLLNRLAQQHVQGASETEITGILTELANYADYHFSTEEAIWQSALAGDTWLHEHIQSHQRFFAHIVELQSGKRAFQAVLDDLFSYLTQWLAYHILDNDKRMAMAVMGVREGLDIDAARVRAEDQMRGATAVLIQTVLSMYQTVSSQALELMHEKLGRQRAEAALRNAQERWQFLMDTSSNDAPAGSPLEKTLRTIIDNVPAGLVVADAKTQRFVFANRWFCRMLGYSLDELLHMSPADIHPSEVLAQVNADFQCMQVGEKKATLAIPVRCKNNSLFTANIERVPLALDGQTSVLAIFTDVTERLRAEQTLESERLRLQNAIDAAQAGTWEWDIPSGLVRYSPRTAAMLGYHTSVMKEGSYAKFLSWIHPDDRAHEQQVMAHHLSGELPRFEIEMRMRHQDTHWVWCRRLGRIMQRNATGEPILVAGISIDISEQKTHREQIEYVTQHDALTGLPNRKLFVDMLAQSMAGSRPNQPLAVAYIDLDGFAGINQTHGEDRGNQLIVEVSHRLASSLHANQYIAHIGGDEFAVVEHTLNPSQSVTGQFEALLNLVAQPLALQGLTLSITASIGVTLFPQNLPVDAEQLLRQANQAMYLAKQAGKNRCHAFDPVKDESLRELFLRLDEIRQGLKRNEFVLYYQPKVQLHTGHVIGFEALIRWQHPTQGLLPPGAFIGLLSEQGLAITLGDWVIEHALAQLADWQAQGLQTNVSINIDAMQLLDPDFADRLQTQLRQQPSVSPKQLELEILETGALENMAHVSALIARLKSMGLECALDDFGTGYSSLTFLKQLAAQTLKIDQSFVRGMLDDTEHATIVNSVLGLARNFARKALAEGVETEAHGRSLIEFGCELGQGYAIARPMPAADVLPWLAQWKNPESWCQSSAVRPPEIPALLAEVGYRAWLKN